MGDFVFGQELSWWFYIEVVWLVLESSYLGFLYSAVLFGWGSEVLGFDDEMLGDYNWESRVLLFLCKDDQVWYGDRLADVLSREVLIWFVDRSTEYGIYTFCGYFFE